MQKGERGEGTIDFVVTLKKVGLFTRAVLEGIYLFYCPRRIFIVTHPSEFHLVQDMEIDEIHKILHYINEETYFCRHFNLTRKDLEREFEKTPKEAPHREFGWWFQQMIKLGASTQIEEISDYFVVWDGDLIPLKKWDLVVKSSTFCSHNQNQQLDYYVAILQKESRSDFNRFEYRRCITHLLGTMNMVAESPCVDGEGTFIMHHMVFHKKRIQEMLHFIMKEQTKEDVSWVLYFISLSHTFYRFSEYMLYSSYMMSFHKEEFHYYPYSLFGKTGIRFRDTRDIIHELDLFCEKVRKRGVYSYSDIKEYFSCPDRFPIAPSYVQFEHVYHVE